MKKRILIVHNDPSLAFFLAETLAELGPQYQVKSCNSAAKALLLNRANVFDLVITDLCTTDLSGLELIRQLNQHSMHTEYILLVSYEHKFPPPEVKLIGGHAIHLLIKPFQMETLLTMIHTIMPIRLEIREFILAV
jgi:DNA-binding NtrC family response regulator